MSYSWILDPSHSEHGNSVDLIDLGNASLKRHFINPRTHHRQRFLLPAVLAKRQLDVLDKNLSNNKFLGGDEYTIADIVTYPWYGACVLHNIYSAAEFLDVESYRHVIRWAKEIEARPAVQRGRRVNRPWGPEEPRVVERHSASDFDV